MPTVSIVLPVYNCEDYLRGCIDSLLAQSFGDFELITIDDGSTDKSGAILAEYAALDERIRVITQKNAGPAAARNRGIAAATGEYLVALDSDDLFDHVMLEKLVTAAQRHQADVCVCQSNSFDGKTAALTHGTSFIPSELPRHDVFSYRDMPDFLFTAFRGWPWDKLVRRDLIEEHGLSYPDLHNSEDLLPNYLALAHAERICAVDQELIHHRTGRSASLSNSRAQHPLDFYQAICLLKQRLQALPGNAWGELSWGFTNWAFSYTVWNIATMTEPNARRMTLDKLIDGGFPELGLDRHAASYFSLDRQALATYNALLAEARGSDKTAAPVVGTNASGYLGQFFLDASTRGYGAAMQELGDWATRRRNHAGPARASEYFTSEEAVDE